jgi:hypothetical protein
MYSDEFYYMKHPSPDHKETPTWHAPNAHSVRYSLFSCSKAEGDSGYQSGFQESKKKRKTLHCYLCLLQHDAS